MALPTLTGEVAFSTAPDSGSPSYQVVSTYLLSAAVTRGRVNELDTVDAGTCRMTLANGDRRFDPTYTQSPYYPYVVPFRKTRLRAVWSSVTYDLYTGYIERWPIVWDGPSWGKVEPTAVDALAMLANTYVSGTFPEETTGARITRVMQASSWPLLTGQTGGWILGTSLLDFDAELTYEVPAAVIDTGQTTVQDVTIPDDQPVSALAHIQQMAEAEAGVFFVDKQGRPTFQQRNHRYGVTSTATFSDTATGSEIFYEDLTPDDDGSRIVNEAIVSAQFGASTVTAVERDLTSQLEFLRRSKPPMTLPLANADDLGYRAGFEVLRYAFPEVRFDSIVVRPAGQDTAWPAMLSLEIGDKVTVKRTPAGGSVSEQIVRTCFVEQISHSINHDDWAITLQLSPGAYYENVWVLETSLLDTADTRLAY